MTENTMNTRAIPTINAVDGFNPADFTRELPNEDGSKSLYLDVKYRLLWFRLHCPNGKIDSEIVRVDDKSAVVACKLYSDKADGADQYIAKSSAQRFLSTEKYGDRYLEIAETAAIGRVLAAAGYGTQFCGAADMFNNIIADAPIDLAALEDAVISGPETASQVVHETKTTVVTPLPVVAPESVAPVEPPKPTLNTVDDYLNTMTLEDAKNVKVNIGRYAGSTLGEIVMQHPKDLEWYVKFYRGNDLALKAGAILLLNAVTSKAS